MALSSSCSTTSSGSIRIAARSASSAICVSTPPRVTRIPTPPNHPTKPPPAHFSHQARSQSNKGHVSASTVSVSWMLQSSCRRIYESKFQIDLRRRFETKFFPNWLSTNRGPQVGQQVTCAAVRSQISFFYRGRRGWFSRLKLFVNLSHALAYRLEARHAKSISAVYCPIPRTTQTAVSVKIATQP